MTLRPDWLTLHRFAGVTAALTMTLISLGVYTAATGSGLACQAQWPLCSDQLIPALTINPDFVEWFHRVWAMFIGFMIIGTAGLAWVGDVSKKTRLAAVAAVLLLPLQVFFGAVTVTIGGLIPGGYTLVTHAAHQLIALTIFTLLGLVTLSSGPGLGLDGIRWALGVAIGLLLPATLLSRALPLLTYSPGAQGWFYLFALSAGAGLLGAAFWSAQREVSRVFRACLVALVGLFVTLLLSRDIVLYTATWQSIHLGVVTITLLATIAAMWFARTTGTIQQPTPPVSGD